MATLHVRGVPEELYAALVRRARSRDSSITAEAIRALRQGLAFDEDDRRAAIDAILAIRKPRPGGLPSSASLIREDRDAR